MTLTLVDNSKVSLDIGVSPNVPNRWYEQSGLHRAIEVIIVTRIV
jgi:hypothetical protein